MKRLALALMAAGLAAAGSAQTLPEAAARDQERREQERRGRERKRPPRPYTDADLRPSSSGSPSPSPSPSPVTGLPASPKPRGWKAPTPAPPAPGSGPATPAPVPSPDRSAEERAALEARWKAIAAERREAQRRAEERVADLEARITSLRNDLSPVGLGDPNREQTRQAEIGRAQQELDVAKAAMAAARAAVESLEDDARRAGALPGWVR